MGIFDGIIFLKQKRYLDVLIILIVFVVGLFVRFYRIGSLPSGFAGHGAVHFAKVVYPYLSPNIPFSEKIAIFLHEETGPVGFLESIGYFLWGVSFVSTRFLPALVGAVTIPLIYVFGRLLTGQRRYGLILSLLLSFSFWHITFSRYENLEHVFAPFHFVLTSTVLLICIRGSSKKTWLLLLGALVGLVFYIYPTNTILLLLVPSYLCFHAYKRGRFESVKKTLFRKVLFLTGFLIVALPQLLIYYRENRLIPIRKQYAPGSLYYFSQAAEIPSQSIKAISVLMNHHHDPWLGGRGRVFNSIEIVFFAVGLLAIICDFYRKNKLFVGSYLVLTFILGIIPGVLGPSDLAFRRIMIAGLAICMIMAYGMDKIIAHAHRLKKRYIIFLCIFLFLWSLGRNVSSYYEGPFSLESEGQRVNKKIAEYVISRLGEKRFIIVKIHGGQREEVRNLILIGGYQKVLNYFNTNNEEKRYRFCFLDNPYNDQPFCKTELQKIDLSKTEIIIPIDLWGKFSNEMPAFARDQQRYDQVYKDRNRELFIVLSYE